MPAKPKMFVQRVRCRRASLIGCLSILALTTLAGCANNSAKSAATRGTSNGFGSYGKGAGQLFEPNGIAVDQRNGDMYVVDSNNARIDKFNRDGKLIFAWGWAIADGKSLTAQQCTIKCFLGVEGPNLGQFQFPEGVAVDNSPTSPSRGDLYVVDIGNHRIQKFNPQGKFMLEIGNGVNDVAHQQGNFPLENRCPVYTPPVLWEICGPGSEGPSKAPANEQLRFTVEGDFIAVGPNGTLYIGQPNAIKEFNPNGTYKTQIRLKPPTEKSKEAGGISALTVDDNGNIYVVRHGIKGVNEYNPNGHLTRTLEPNLPPAQPEGPTPALTTDTHNNIYIDTNHNKQHTINQYNPQGQKTATLDQNQPDGLHGITYNPTTNQLYIINTTTNGTNQTHIKTIRPH